MKLGYEIKEAIKERGLTQTFVAEKIGVSPQTFNGICNDRQGISLEVYFRLCEVLGVSLEYFAEKTDDASA